jgi:hypothetical protein
MRIIIKSSFVLLACCGSAAVIAPLALGGCGDSAENTHNTGQALGGTAVSNPQSTVSGGISTASGGMSPGDSTNAGGASVPSNLPTYGGGPILQPEIVSIYWGSFSTDQQNTMQSYLQGLATFISGSTSPQGQEPAVFQYGVRGARVGATYADSGNLPSNNNVPGHGVRSDAFNEITRLQGQGKIPGFSAERLFMVFTSGITFDDDYCGSPGADANCFCAQHQAAGMNQWWSVDPLPYDASCGSGGFGGFDQTAIWQSQTSHELFEAATDPAAFHGGLTGGWTGEIGDPCNWGIQAANTVAMSFGAVQTIADKVQNACSIWTLEQVPQLTIVHQPEGPLSDENDAFALASDQSVLHLGGDSLFGWSSSWQDLGGVLTSPPVALAGARGTGTLDVFGQGTDNGFWLNQSNDGGSTWTGWQSIGGPFNGPPTVASPSVNDMIVVGMGIDGHAYAREWTASSGWQSSWSGNFSMILNGPPAAASAGQSVFARGQDGHYYSADWNDFGSPGWSSFSLVSNGVFISEPVLPADSTVPVDVLGQGTDWGYYHVQEVFGSGWQAPQGLSGTYMGPPGAAFASGGSSLVVVGQGLDTFYYGQQEQNGSWINFQNLNGFGYGGAAPVLLRNGLNAPVVGSDFNAWDDVLTGQWSGFGQLPIPSPAIH